MRFCGSNALQIGVCSPVCATTNELCQNSKYRIKVNGKYTEEITSHRGLCQGDSIPIFVPDLFRRLLVFTPPG
jgi:hypothetical protein